MYTKDKGMKDFYKYYVDNCKKLKMEYQDYSTFSKITRECNLLIRDKILNNDKFDIPYNNGELSIIKFENKFDPEKQYRWKVDYKKSKELGTIVYYGSQYGYRWKWHKSSAVTSGKMFYHFKPARKSSRLIAEAIKNNIEYYEK